MEQKEALRQRLKAIRGTLSQDEIEQKSHVIIDYLLNTVAWHKVHAAHIYSSVPQWKEVDTQELIRRIGQDRPNILITSPTIERNNPIPQKQFDLIIVPVLGFDRLCFRLGMGGGWYDRFLSSQHRAQKIGLAFSDCFIEEGLPRELHDEQLDKIVTEQGIISI